MAGIDINHLISSFEEGFVDHDYSRNEALRKTFIEEFPMDGFMELELERYALGMDKQSMCWWLEYNTNELGSIKGGSASKHKIFFSKKENKWIYPSTYKNETEAWEALRAEFHNYLKGFETSGEAIVQPMGMLASMNMVRSKLLYMYFSDQLIPIYNVDHLRMILEFFGYERVEIKDWDFVKLNKELKKKQSEHDVFRNWDVFKFMMFLYKNVISTSKIYKIAPGDNAAYWEECFNNGYICIGWDEVGNLKDYADYNEFKFAFSQIYKDYDKSKVTEKSNEIWTFFSLNAGDIIVANKGVSKVLGVGQVLEQGYEYDTTRSSYKHIVHVNWKKDFHEKEIKAQNYWAFKTVFNISEKLYKDIIDETQVDPVTPPVIPDIKPGKEVIDEVFTDEEEKFFIQMEKNLIRKGNVILYGPPGTGKTYLGNRYLSWKNSSRKRINHKYFCTFHPSFNYEDFIEGYRPYSNDKGEILFKLTDGIFKDLCKEAEKKQDEDFYIIIDEINRGNVEKIFGELITLIERDKRGMELALSQSKEAFHVPQNVYIIGTMNTTDRSIKAFDAALRRRFAFIECMPDYELISNTIDRLGLSPKEILMKLNAKLRAIEDRDKQIGQAYFMKYGKQIETLEEFREVYIYEIIPLISEYCFNDYSKMKEIIGAAFVDEKSEELKNELIYGTDDYFAAEINNKFGDDNA